MTLLQGEHVQLVTDKIAKAEARIVELRRLLDAQQEQCPPELRLAAMAMIAAFETSLLSLKAQLATDRSSALLAPPKGRDDGESASPGA